MSTPSIKPPPPILSELTANKGTKVLMVGCGAVGQVFGFYLQKAGVELGFHARPASADKLKQALEQGGLPLYQVTRVHRHAPITHRLESYQVVTDIAESQRFKPDQIWFTTPSPVYYSSWFREFLQEVPSERVVCFPPEGRRPEFIPHNVGDDRLVFGGITFMAWQGFLEAGNSRTEGVNFWRPPLVGIPLTGSEKACPEVARLLRQAGFRVSVGEQDSPAQAAATAVLTAFMAGLELAGWSLETFRKSPWLKQSALGARHAVLSQLSRTGTVTRTLLGILLSSPGFYLASLFLPLLTPFEIEKYLQFHYLKTREQTLTLLEVFAKDGERRGLPVENIHILRQGLLQQACLPAIMNQ